jgi:S-adenosylmethionine/arginine decarboxylase-like enzyme
LIVENKNKNKNKIKTNNKLFKSTKNKLTSILYDSSDDSSDDDTPVTKVVSKKVSKQNTKVKQNRKGQYKKNSQELRNKLVY